MDTAAPKPYTEATLLRAMETAGKLVDNDELRDALKENGIGRPSTRAAIIGNLIQTSLYPKRTQEPDCYSHRSGTYRTDSRRAVEISRTDRYLGKELREIERQSYDASTFWTN